MGRWDEGDCAAQRRPTRQLVECLTSSQIEVLLPSRQSDLPGRSPSRPVSLGLRDVMGGPCIGWSNSFRFSTQIMTLEKLCSVLLLVVLVNEVRKSFS